MIIRPATFADADAMIEVKESLAFEHGTTSSTEGGFLLGTDKNGYLQRIACGCAWVLDVNGVKGFSIVLPDQALRMSDIWHRRTDIQWSKHIEELESKQLGYFDQLAVSKGEWRKHAPVLAITNILDFLSLNPDYLLSTTVLKPIRNLAAVPYLRYLGAESVGQIDEIDPQIGQLLSEVWLARVSSLRYFIGNPPTPKIAHYIAQSRSHFTQHRT